MNTTPPSLLARLRQPGEQAAWVQFVQLYTPLLLAWAHRLGLADPDAADLVQEVFTVLVQELPGFAYDPGRRFRGWLWTITRNKFLELRRQRQLPLEKGAALLAEIADPAANEDFTEAEYRRHLVQRALELMQAEFQPATWKACWEFVVNDRPAAEVAAELGLSVGAVYIAKSRVLRRLRRRLEGLLD